jgi:hypothetical protein
MTVRKLALSIGWLLVGGCSFKTSCNPVVTIDEDHAAELVKKAVAEEVGEEGGEPAVTCPRGIKIAKGGRFDCHVVVGGVEGTLTLEQTDDKTNADIVKTTGLLISRKLEAAIAAKVKESSGSDATVDCGPPVRPSTPGDVFRCHAVSATGASVDVAVTVKNDAARVAFDLLPDTARPAPAAEAAATGATPPTGAPVPPTAPAD